MRLFATLAVILLLAACNASDSGDVSGGTDPDDLMERATALAKDALIVDTHIDVPYRLANEPDDVSASTEGGDFDYPRAVAGGLDVMFMSIYTPANLQDTEGASAALADSLIDMVEGIAAAHPDKFAVVKSTEDVETMRGGDKVLFAYGMENGAPIGDDLSELQRYYDRGIRYITLTHGKANKISDSSYDSTRTWNGLSPFGEEVVAEMNRLGIMVDISHVSDEAFYDVMEITTAPVIASHSSARTFTPGFERNMDDAMIERLAENGGVIMINFGSTFLLQRVQDDRNALREQFAAEMEERGIEPDTPEAEAFQEEFEAANPLRLAEMTDVADHIDHVVELVGIDHVGLGSDYDGVGPTLPVGLEDVSTYPNLVAELLRRGYSEADIRKLLGENLMRVWREVETIAAGS